MQVPIKKFVSVTAYVLSGLFNRPLESHVIRGLQDLCINGQPEYPHHAVAFLGSSCIAW